MGLFWVGLLFSREFDGTFIASKILMDHRRGGLAAGVFTGDTAV
jgi:hypothetical protein